MERWKGKCYEDEERMEKREKKGRGKLERSG
jgi:hypothetical protein